MSLLFPAAESQAQSATRYILRADPNNQMAVFNTYGLTMVEQVGPPDAVLVTGPTSVTVDQLTQQVSSDPRVTGFEVEQRAVVVEADPRAQQTASTASLTPALMSLGRVNFYGTQVWSAYLNQPFLAQIDLAKPSASNIGTGAIVAVIDTGVDPTHPALQGVLLPGYDFTRDQAGTASEWPDLNQSTAAILNQSTAAILNQSTAVILNQSTVAILDQSTAAILNGAPLPAEFGHGTMVAGLIHLVAPGAQIMPLKAFSADGSARLGDIIRAIYYAVNHGVNVINMSFSQEQISSEMLRAVNYANRHGVISVASVGNNGQTTAVYPASLGYVIGVGSVSASGTISTFSNYGPDLVTLVAPGEDLITTFPGNHYAAVWGTSSSAALVSANEAIGLSRVNQPGGNPADFADLDDAMDAITSVHPYDPNVGWGLLDVRKMSNIVLSAPQYQPH